MKPKTMARWVCVALLLIAVAASARGGDSLTVAVFDFQSRDKELTELGQLAADLVRVELSTADGLRTVTREEMEKVLGELKLAMAGVTSEAAPQVGNLLGAQVLVLGRVFALNGKVFVTVKVVGVETGRVYGEKVSGPRDAAEAMATELGAKVIGLIDKGRDRLVAKVQLERDQLAALKKALGDGKLPRVFVYVREEVIGQRVPDPAAQTEISYILKKMGCEVVKDRNGELARWADRYDATGAKAAPPSSASVDLILIGEAFAEFAARTGDLLSSRARIELEAIDPATGKMLATDRETGSAVDLSEQVAAKSALQKVAAEITRRLLPQVVSAWRKERRAQK